MQAKGRETKSKGQAACMPCRRRKSRCKFESGSQACLMCRAHETDCVLVAPQRSLPRRLSTPRARTKTTPPRTTPPTGRTPETAVGQRRDAASTEAPTPNAGSLELTASASARLLGHDSAQSRTGPLVPLDEAEDDSPHIIGPAIADDEHFLESYLSTNQAGNGERSIRAVLPGMSSSPVVFTRVKKRPLGIPRDMSPSKAKLQTIEKLIEPHQQRVVDMYFAKANSCFPLLDESFLSNPSFIVEGRISAAVRACLHANSLIYWRHDPDLAHHYPPDGRFIWNLALEALYSELHLSPGMPSIVAILLNVGGRPTTSMMGNGILLGSAISLAHCLGLNRDPSSWNIPEQEKSLRVRIWWCLVIHDRWASLMYGTPPHIRRDHYDVPAPKMSFESGEDRRFVVFQALASLTETLGPYLEDLYSVPTPQSEDRRTSRDLNLDAWTDTLPASVRKVIIRGTDLDMPGAANLRLCFLTARFFSRRLELGVEVEGTTSAGQTPDERLLNVRRTVEEIVLFVSELTKMQLGDFWLPTTALVLSSAATFLVRLAVQAEIPASGPSQSLSLSLAKDLLITLRSHKEKYGWELGDICLAQYGDKLDKLTVEHGPADAESAWSDSAPPFSPDPALLESIIADQWDPVLWGQMT